MSQTEPQQHSSSIRLHCFTKLRKKKEVTGGLPYLVSSNTFRSLPFPCLPFASLLDSVVFSLGIQLQERHTPFTSRADARICFVLVILFFWQTTQTRGPTFLVFAPGIQRSKKEPSFSTVTLALPLRIHGCVNRPGIEASWICKSFSLPSLSCPNGSVAPSILAGGVMTFVP